MRNPIPPLLPAIAILAVLLGSMPSPRAAGFTLNLGPLADTTLFAEAPANNLGASDTLVVGSTGHGQPGRALVRFSPAAAIPPGMVVTAATLEFSVTKVPPGGIASTFQLRRVLQSWRQGSGTGNLGRQALEGEANWTARALPDLRWSVPGGAVGTDFGPVSASVPVSEKGRYTVTSAAMVEDVRAWLAEPSTAFGWVLISDREQDALTARRLASMESAVARDWPRLVLEYEPAPAPGPVLDGGRVEEGRFRFGFQAEAGNLYEVQFRDRDALGTPAAWQVLTQAVVKLQPVRVEVVDPLPVAAGPGARFYRVADVGDVD